MAQPELDLSALLSSLQEQDLSSLLDTASALLQQSAPQPQQKPHDAPAPSSPDPALLLKLTQLFSLLNRQDADPRTDLLFALRPLVSETRRQRIDTAARMLQLLHILPQLKELGL